LIAHVVLLAQTEEFSTRSKERDRHWPDLFPVTSRAFTAHRSYMYYYAGELHTIFTNEITPLLKLGRFYFLIRIAEHPPRADNEF
jgi:hypothetical protein